MTEIINRNGEIELLDFTQIKEVIEIACIDLEINPLQLESRFKLRVKPQITTKEIQKELIDTAVTLIPEDQTWDLVASRLLLWDLYKEYEIKTGRKPYSNYYQDVVDLIDSGYMSGDILELYTEKELDWFGVNLLDSDYDKFFPYSGIFTLSQRYLLDTVELPQTMFLTHALLLARSQGQAMSIYQALGERKLSLATPLLANHRTAKHKSYTSCFISMLNDTIESIFDEVKNTALISKNGGGVGLNLSHIRAKGSDLMGLKGKATGVIPWLKIFNDVAVAVNQSGKRKGAITVALDLWHADIVDFLGMSSLHGDQRLKAYDLLSQVVVPDLFMKRLAKNEDWMLFCPHEVKEVFGIDLASLYGDEFESAYQKLEAYAKTSDSTLKCTKAIKTKELFGLVMRSAEQRGIPYLFFKDTVNRANPNKHEGYIPSGNLCMESFSNVGSGYIHCCNLISLNLATIEDELELKNLSRLAVKILDKTIDITTPPVPEAKAHNDRYRTIGIGCMGLADWLVKNNLTYQDTTAINNLFETIAYTCIETSVVLAGNKGTYPAFEGSDLSKGIYNGHTAEELNAMGSGQYDWVELMHKVKTIGIRNSHLLAIAPNTASSLIQGCTASVLPIYNANFIDKAGDRLVPVVPPFDSSKYQINTKLRQEIVVKAMATIQQWIDTGISMELVFNQNADVYEKGYTLQSPKDTFQVYKLAWELGCKTVYYTRNVQKQNIQDLSCDCAN